MTRTLPNLVLAEEPSSGDDEQRSRPVRLDDFGDVLFVPDMAALLGTSTRTIKRHLRIGRFPIRPLDSIDRRVRFAKADVERFLRIRRDRENSKCARMTAPYHRS